VSLTGSGQAHPPVHIGVKVSGAGRLTHLLTRLKVTGSRQAHSPLHIGVKVTGSGQAHSPLHIGVKVTGSEQAHSPPHQTEGGWKQAGSLTSPSD